MICLQIKVVSLVYVAAVICEVAFFDEFFAWFVDELRHCGCQLVDAYQNPEKWMDDNDSE